MQVIYAAPFILFSMLGFLVCVAVPQWRPYKVQGNGCSGRICFLLDSCGGCGDSWADFLNLGLFTKEWSGPRDAVALVFIYFIPGLLGSWCATVIVRKIANRRNS